MFKSKSVLITGGAGFIGKKLANYLSNRKYNVLVVDDLSSGNTNGLNSKIRFEEFDILKNQKLVDTFKLFIKCLNSGF